MSFAATNSPPVETGEKPLKASNRQLLFVSSVSSVNPLFLQLDGNIILKFERFTLTRDKSINTGEDSLAPVIPVWRLIVAPLSHCRG